jgi:ferredoxin
VWVQDMLDLAHGRRQTSRLGCQLTLAAPMQGMVVCIPDGSNNLMDHIPFPDA